MTTRTRTPTAPASPVTPPSAAQPPASSALRVGQAPIPYPPTRQQEMAAYSLRHYGTASWQLTPTMIVLHYTAGGTWAGARATFAADTVSTGELPGTCSHYVVDKDGTVYQLVPTSIRCRHTIGLNDAAIGIEMVRRVARRRAGPTNRSSAGPRRWAQRSPWSAASRRSSALAPPTSPDTPRPTPRRSSTTSSADATTTRTGRPPTSRSSAHGSDRRNRSTSLLPSIPGWSAGRARLTLNQD
jgi:hypothetical protein